MRSVVIKAADNGGSFELPSDVGLIAEVIERGFALHELIYELTVKGDELISMLIRLGLYEKVADKINTDKLYTVTAYDW